MHISTLLSVVSASHLTAYVTSPFPDRGGLMLVSPPEHLKSTIINVLRPYPNALVVSDMNQRMLSELIADAGTERLHTIAISDFHKLFERHSSTSANVVGTLRALTGEAFSGAAFQDARINRFDSRAFVVGALTPSAYERHMPGWLEDGFARRFLWVLYRIRNRAPLMNAILEWKAYDFGEGVRFPLPLVQLPFSVTVSEMKNLKSMVANQYGDTIPWQLLAKIVSVLRWDFKRRGQRDQSMALIKSFSEGLGKGGADVTL